MTVFCIEVCLEVNVVEGRPTPSGQDQGGATKLELMGVI